MVCPHISFFLFLPFFLLPFSLAQNKNGTVNIGSSITAGEGEDPWLSPSSDFAFGFQNLLDDDENQFLLCIWYRKLPEKTIVWYPNTVKNNSVPRGSKLELDAQIGLVLRDPGNQEIWKTDFLNFQDVGNGFLSDSGNFVLMGSHQSTRLWESFKNPADTLLPSQEMEIGGVLNSRRSETNFSPGRFSLRMLEDGNLVMNSRSDPGNIEFDDEYYNSGTSDAANSSNSGLKLTLDDRGFAYVENRNNETKNLNPSSSSIPPISDFYHRVKLNSYGVLTQYYYPRASSPGNSHWTALWSQPDNICVSIDGVKRGSGPCGFNSVCRIDDFQRPVCNCLRGYSLIDPRDQYGSCRPDFSQECGDDNGAEELFGFVTLPDTDWPEYQFEKLRPSTEEQCRNSCLQDCFCAVAVFKVDSCWKKSLPLPNGRIDTSLDLKSFLKFRKDGVSLPNPNNDDPVTDRGNTKNGPGNLKLIGSVLLGSSVFINILLISAIFLGFFIIHQKKFLKLFPGRNSLEMSLRCFTYRELEEATDGFKQELGRGSFGIVYRGLIPSGPSIAVKKLDRILQDTEKEFRTEVKVIGQTHHKNLVRLIGYCDEGQNRLLVYEYMSNGTLAGFLFSDLRPNWSQRTEIAQGVARGLNYLHQECSTQIIHCDIKPQNILLDEYYNAKISDFGLAKLLMMNQSKTETGIRGTRGYVAPEWFNNTEVSAKVDVYSFGVVLLEIITCRRSLEDLENGGGERVVLADLAWDCYQEGVVDDLVGGDDVEALSDLKKLKRFLMVGLWCIQEEACFRPTMRMVSQMLEGVVEVASPPCPHPLSLIAYITCNCSTLSYRR